jgi:hypothetical protein
MKTLLTTFSILLACFCNAQTQPHIHAAPPVNPGYPFVRSLSVDCADAIVNDMCNGSQTGLESDLLDYISDNYIGYVVLRDLENSNVFGNPVLENLLHRLLFDIRQIDPNIQVGLCGSSSAIFQSGFVIDPQLLTKPCLGEMLIAYSKLSFNQPAIPDLSNKLAIISFFLKVMRFEDNAELVASTKRCQNNFDALYLDFPYWNTTTSMQDMQTRFQDFKDILNVMRIVKCHSVCLRNIDAEFLPSDLFLLQGWTAIDQITDADTLIDRVVLPAYTNDASGVFDMSCKMMHFLSDRFSKTGTKILIKLNAESQNFTYCNSSVQSQNYLGDYLNGTVTPNGNMLSVEKQFVNHFNDINYVCPACHCSTYVDNHYDANNIWGNILSGTIWGPYTMMNGNNLFRKKYIEPIDNEIHSSKLYDLLGREIKYNPTDPDGITLPYKGCYLKDVDGKIIKVIIN